MKELNNNSNHVSMDDVINPEQAVEMLNRIAAKKAGINFKDWKTLDDIEIPLEAAINGETLGFVNCSCGRVHAVTLGKDGEKHVDTGWY